MVTVVLTALKFVVAFISGSVGVLSEAIHSFLDVVSAALSFFTVRHAVKPADDDHPFGHGKIETLSSLFEAVLLLVAAGLIIQEGIDQIRRPHELQYAGWAMAVIIVSLIASYGAYLHNKAAAKETESSALHVNALHFLSDVVASLGVLVGLVLIKLTGWLIIDPLMAFAVAGYIIVISARQVYAALYELSDGQLPDSEVSRIKELLLGYQGSMLEIHDLRTRRSGSHRHIDFHLVVCGNMSVDESHAVCDSIEEKIGGVYPNSTVQIHVEPCEAERSNCAEIDCHVKWNRTQKE